MSLKAFHLVFIIASILLAFGVAAWGVWSYLQEGGAVYLYYAGGSFALGVVLVRYSRYFLKKLRNFSYL